MERLGDRHLSLPFSLSAHVSFIRISGVTNQKYKVRILFLGHCSYGSPLKQRGSYHSGSDKYQCLVSLMTHSTQLGSSLAKDGGSLVIFSIHVIIWGSNPHFWPP